MAGILKSFKRAFMGELLQKTAVPVDDGSARLTMRVKRDKLTRERYVVLGLVAATNYKHAELSFDEFQQFLEAVHSVQKRCTFRTRCRRSRVDVGQLSSTSPQNPNRPPTCRIWGCGFSYDQAARSWRVSPMMRS